MTMKLFEVVPVLVLDLLWLSITRTRTRRRTRTRTIRRDRPKSVPYRDSHFTMAALAGGNSNVHGEPSAGFANGSQDPFQSPPLEMADPPSVSPDVAVTSAPGAANRITSIPWYAGSSRRKATF